MAGCGHTRPVLSDCLAALGIEAACLPDFPVRAKRAAGSAP